MGLDIDIIERIAELFWKKASPSFEGITDESELLEANSIAELMVKFFLNENPGLWSGMDLDPDDFQVLVEEIVDRMP